MMFGLLVGSWLAGGAIGIATGTSMVAWTLGIWVVIVTALETLKRV